MQFTTCSKAAAAIEPRLIPVEGALNTRDIGGYPTQSGQKIRFGKVFRSSELSYVSDAGVAVLAGLNLSYVVDFRGVKEAADAPDRLPEGVRVVAAPIIRDDLDPARIDEYLGRHSFPPAMYDRERVSAYGPYYRMLTLVNSYEEPGYVDAVAAYRPLFQSILELPEDRALLAHCTGGRDRTGVGIFLLMTALGVPEELALSDYLKSNVYLQPERQNPKSTAFRQYRFSNIYTQPPENEAFTDMAAALGTTSQAIYDSIRLRPEFPKSLMANIEARYGKFSTFLEQKMGVGTQELLELKRRLLTD